MACRGVYYALLPDESRALFSAGDTDAQLELLNSIYPAADSDGRIQSVDKSWDAMHRILCDGWLDREHGDEFLRACVLGGVQLSDRDEYIISYLEPWLVERVAEAIAVISQHWFRTQYYLLDRIPPGKNVHRYELKLSQDDCDYTWAYFTEVRKFYQQASQRKLATVFQVDQ